MFYDFFRTRNLTPAGKRIVVATNRLILRHIRPLIPSDSPAVLEIGVGDALFASLFRTAFPAARYTAIEPNPTLAEHARGQGIEIINASVPPFPDHLLQRRFDLIYLSHVLEHFVDHREVLSVLSALNRMLATDGKLVIFYPDWSDFKEDYFTVDYTHAYILNERRMRHILTDAGCSILRSIRVRGCFHDNPALSLVHLGVKSICRPLFGLTGYDPFFKAAITFGRNILVIAERARTSPP